MSNGISLELICPFSGMHLETVAITPSTSATIECKLYHAHTSLLNKDVIHKSMQIPDGIIRIVFATISLGMGVNRVGINTIWHY